MSADPSESQLEWERHRGRLAAAAAIAAGLIPLIGGIVVAPLLPLPDDPNLSGAARLAVSADEQPITAIAPGIVSAVGLVLLPLALNYLVRATRARNERTPAIVGPLLTAAALGLAAVGLLQRILLVDAAQGFADGEVTTEAATDVLTSGPLGALNFVGLALSVALGVAIVLLAINAMRAGLLSRFMGIIGVIAGVGYALPQVQNVFPLLPLQVFWLVGLGFLFMGRWPGGRGPAWERVEAVPWPTAAERAEQDREKRVAKAQAEAYGEEAGRGDEDGSGEGPSEDGAAAAEPAQPRPASRKKRRRGR